jgi:excisionase family DNA binding protein
MPNPPDYPLSPRQAAAVVGVHEDTLKKWASEGRVAAWRSPGGWWRFRRADLEALLAPVARDEVEPEDASA